MDFQLDAWRDSRIRELDQLIARQVQTCTEQVQSIRRGASADALAASERAQQQLAALRKSRKQLIFTTDHLFHELVCMQALSSVWTGSLIPLVPAEVLQSSYVSWIASGAPMRLLNDDFVMLDPVFAERTLQLLASQNLQSGHVFVVTVVGPRSSGKLREDV